MGGEGAHRLESIGRNAQFIQYGDFLRLVSMLVGLRAVDAYPGPGRGPIEN